MKQRGKLVIVIGWMIVCFLSLVVAADELSPCAVIKEKTISEAIQGVGYDLTLEMNSQSSYTISKMISLDNGYTIIFSLKQDLCDDLTLKGGTAIRRRLTSTCDIDNPYGFTIATFSAVGIFDTDDIAVAPYKAYGVSSVNTVENIENILGPKQSSSWVKVLFSGLLSGSNSQISLECTIKCDSNGKHSASWA
ncbi:MAG: hypothetical protein Q4E09_05075 [Eubacteriales bacterium]|nr:hypothetical protein [Eubacteriales bacterium]